jgi:divinyl chlorophyllide a 8-vinyl-reductase
LKFEKKLAEQSEMTFSIVRPTAFFKSVSGQYESILEGNPYVLFGDGAVTRCNPIAAEDLATFMCDSALEEQKEQRWGKVVNVGGPDAPLTNKMLGEVSPRLYLLLLSFLKSM